MFSIEVQRKVTANGGVITLQDLRDLAVRAKTDCYHVVDAADDAAPRPVLRRKTILSPNWMVWPELAYMLDFAGIGRMMRCSENGGIVGNHVL